MEMLVFFTVSYKYRRKVVNDFVGVSMDTMQAETSNFDENRRRLRMALESLIKKHEENQWNAWLKDRWQEEVDEFESFMTTNFRDFIPVMDRLMYFQSNAQVRNRNETAYTLKIQGDFYLQARMYRFAIVVYYAGLLLNPTDPRLKISLHDTLSTTLFVLEHYGTSLKHCEFLCRVFPIPAILLRASLCRVKLLQRFRSTNHRATITQKLDQCFTNVISVITAGIQRETSHQFLIKTLQQHNYRFETGKFDLESLTPTKRWIKDHRVFFHIDHLVWPVYIFYPDFGGMGFIEQFDENHSSLSLSMDLGQLVPEFLQLYFTAGTRVFRFSATKTLKEVLTSGSFFIRDGSPCFVAFVKGCREEALFLAKHEVLNLN